MQTTLTPVHAAMLRSLRALMLDRPELAWMSRPAGGGRDWLSIELIDSRPWQSATLEGIRHQLGFHLRGPMHEVEDAGDLIERALEDADVSLGTNDLWADAAVTQGSVRWDGDGRAVADVTVEVLTLTLD